MPELYIEAREVVEHLGMAGRRDDVFNVFMRRPDQLHLVGARVYFAMIGWDDATFYEEFMSTGTSDEILEVTQLLPCVV